MGLSHRRSHRLAGTPQENPSYQRYTKPIPKQVWAFIMIESKTLGAAVGIQRQAVVDKTESTAPPSTSAALIIGRFKRGRLDKPFRVARNNYQALLGYDPTNPSYTVVEDTLKSGVSSVMVRRVGSSAGIGGGGGGGGGVDDGSDLEIQHDMSLKNYWLTPEGWTSNRTLMEFKLEVNGVIFNEDKSLSLDMLDEDTGTGTKPLSEHMVFYSDSEGTFYIYPQSTEVMYVKLYPSDEQRKYTDLVYGENAAVIDPDGTIRFRLQKPDE